jgi:biotin/methionine sulfoxide reductase
MLCSPGGEYSFNGHRAVYPDIRLIYWAGGNPFHHHQDLNRLQRAWQKPETIIVHDSWWTATARRADIVLPATTPLERNDVGGSSRDNFLLAMHQAIAPVGEARNDFDIFRALADRLGYAAAFTEGRDEMAWCQFIYERVRASAERKGFGLPGFQQFWAEGFAQLPLSARAFVLFEGFRADPQKHPLKTPSGKIEIASERIAQLGHHDLPPHPAWLEPAEWLGNVASNTDFPVHLLTNQPSTRLHSQMDPGPVAAASKVAGREPIRINAADAARRQIKDGDVVRVFNARGACLAGAVVDDGLLPSVAVMATGAWLDQDGAVERHGNPNVLTLDIGTSPLTQGSSAQTALVEIERWTGALPPLRVLTPPHLMGAEGA